MTSQGGAWVKAGSVLLIGAAIGWLAANLDGARTTQAQPEDGFSPVTVTRAPVQVLALPAAVEAAAVAAALEDAETLNTPPEISVTAIETAVSASQASAEAPKADPKAARVSVAQKAKPKLTPEQRRILDVLVQQAREDNAQPGSGKLPGGIEIQNVAVVGTQLVFFYQVPKPYDAIDRAQLQARQSALIKANLCSNGTAQALAKRFDITYAYQYQSQDNRLVMRLSGLHDSC